MAIYTPSELHRFLDGLGIHPKKGLSQNFLIDGNIVRKICNAAKASPGDTILEIGPGPGCLTEQLLQTGAHVVAVEKDKTLAKALLRLQTPDQRLQVINEDILKVNLDQELSPPVKVVANLPYHLTTPILSQLTKRYDLFSSIVVMVQKEVAERITAAPGTKTYGHLTLFLNFYADCHYAFTVKRSCFYPQPKVDSAVIVINPHAPPDVDIERFFAMTRTAFQHRRKMLRASLKKLYSPDIIEQALANIGHSPKARPEELSLEEWLKLFSILTAAAG